MGSLGRRQVANRLIQGSFQPIIGTHTIGSPGDHLVLAVEASHTAQGVRSFCPEPVEQEGAVNPQHLRDFVTFFIGLIPERMVRVHQASPWSGSSTEFVDALGFG